jgi:hypothetical protein
MGKYQWLIRHLTGGSFSPGRQSQQRVSPFQTLVRSMELEHARKGESNRHGV